jgi:hypothetical protein
MRRGGVKMNYFNYKYYIDSVMNLLNGQVNKNLRCYRYSYIYSTDKVYARECNGAITFNLQSMAYAFRNMEPLTRFAYIIRTTSHELSHVDQDVNYHKYERDYSYKAWIEKSNELNSVCFIIENLNMIKRNLGDFDHTILEDLYQYAKTNGTNYIPSSKSKMVSNIMETYMIDTNKTRYKELDTILLNLNGIRYMIKHKGEVIDPNILYPVINELSNFNSMKVFNLVKKEDNTLIIKVQTDDEQRRLEEIIFRIDKKYIMG